MITALIYLLIYLLIIGAVLALALWIIKEIPLPDPFARIARAIVMVIACLIAILLLLNFVGLEGGRPLLR